MTKVLDDEAIARAFRAAQRALAAGDPDTLAGRFVPPPRDHPEAAPPAEPPRRHAAR